MSEQCNHCGREMNAPCRNTRDMEDGDLDCFRALIAAGGGERSAAWLAKREGALTPAESR